MGIKCKICLFRCFINILRDVHKCFSYYQPKILFPILTACRYRTIVITVYSSHREIQNLQPYLLALVGFIVPDFDEASVVAFREAWGLNNDLLIWQILKGDEIILRTQAVCIEIREKIVHKSIAR